MSYCAYKNCENKYKPLQTIPFYSIPKDYRRDTWIKNSGNPSLKDTPAHIKRFICENHFAPKYLRKQFSRTILTRDAVPYPHDEIKLMKLDKECEDSIKPESHQEQNDQSNYQCSESLQHDEFQKGTEVALIDDYLDDPDEYSDESEELFTSSEEFVENNEEVVKYIDIEEEKIDEAPSELDIAIPSPSNIEENNVFDNNSSLSEKRNYNEDEHFALSLVGPLQRLPSHVKSLVKLRILHLITQAELTDFHPIEKKRKM